MLELAHRIVAKGVSSPADKSDRTAPGVTGHLEISQKCREKEALIAIPNKSGIG
jgi:hypothetical protein